MRRTKVFRTERFIVTWVYMSEVDDILTKGLRGVVLDDRAIGAHAFVVGGRVTPQLLEAPPGYQGFPGDMDGPFAFRPTGVNISLSAALIDTVYACCLPRDADFLRQSGNYVAQAELFTVGDGEVEEKFSGLSHEKWNAATRNFDKGNSSAVLEKHAEAVVFTDTQAYNDLFEDEQ